MKIAIPVAAYETGTTGEYVARAFRKLGHEAEILSQWDFYNSFRVGGHDFYFCVDSGGPLNLFEPSIKELPMTNLAFWMIDYRRGKTLKNPNDLETCKEVSRRGGKIYQSQYRDLCDCAQYGVDADWLPLAADSDVWSDIPIEEKKYDVGFVGNVWDSARAEALDKIKDLGLSCSFRGHGSAYMEEGAKLLRQSRIGFNISSHFYEGPTVHFDVNMRVFETLSCGLPLVTNKVPSLELIFGNPLPSFIMTYRDVQDVPFAIGAAVLHGEYESFRQSGHQARQWILDNATYVHRVKKVLDDIDRH